MENDFSAIKSLNELKNLLDSGAITQEEYDVLKRKIIFGNAPATPPPAPPVPTEPVRHHPIFSQNPVPAPPPAPSRPDPYKSEQAFNPNPVPPPPPKSVEVNPLAPEYERVETNPKPIIVDARAKAREYLNTPPPIHQPEELTQVKKKDWLLTILISLGVLLLLALVAYQLLGDRDSENLTSKSGPDTEEVAKEDGQLETDPMADATTSTRSDRIDGAGIPETATAPTTTPTPTAEPATNLETPVAATPTPTAPTISNEEALNRIKDRLESYYDDVKTAPFNAQRHFASTVERYYTLINTTPAAINDNINTYHFEEFQNSESTIEDGTLKLESNRAGGFEVTYIENGQAFRKSKGQNQETKARVRARFDPNFRMTYFRQEQLLENKFLDE